MRFRTVRLSSKQYIVETSTPWGWVKVGVSDIDNKELVFHPGPGQYVLEFKTEAMAESFITDILSGHYYCKGENNS